MTAAPPVLDQLIERFDASAFDAPTGRARLRLRVDDASEWDFVIRGGTWRLEPADRDLRADGRLGADRATWARVARDLRGGMNAFPADGCRSATTSTSAWASSPPRAGAASSAGSCSRGCGRRWATSRSHAPGTRTPSRS